MAQMHTKSRSKTISSMEAHGDNSQTHGKESEMLNFFIAFHQIQTLTNSLKPRLGSIPI